jgi:hypothetical protein
MNFLTRLRSWLKWMVKRQRLEGALEAGVRFHIDSYAADLARSGVPAAEAMRRARIDLAASSRTRMLFALLWDCAGGMICGATCNMERGFWGRARGSH